jgi:hypothetical protein
LREGASTELSLSVPVPATVPVTVPPVIFPLPVTAVVMIPTPVVSIVVPVAWVLRHAEDARNLHCDSLRLDDGSQGVNRGVCSVSYLCGGMINLGGDAVGQEARDQTPLRR